MNEGEQKSSLEKTQEEAELLKKKIESGETKIERELSPEIMEKIMEKVSDINESGTAYTVITTNSPEKYNDRILSIFKNGVLGGQPGMPRKKSEWTRLLQRKGKGPKAAPVFFNIIGRSRNTAPNSGGELERFNSGRLEYEGVAIIFDINKFIEVGLPLSRDYGKGEDRLNPKDTVGYEAVLEPYTYWAPRPDDADSIDRFFKKNGIVSAEQLRKAWNPGSEELKAVSKELPYLVSPDGLIQPDSEYGFVLAYRINPGLFRGIVLPNKEDPEAFKEIMREVGKNGTEFLIPIYNRQGDLLWPTKMSYEDVQRFVAGRKTKNMK